MEANQEPLTSNTKNGLFKKLLEQGIDDDLAKQTMCFWMFLETEDFKDIHEKLYLANASDFSHACTEAENVLTFLNPNHTSTESSMPCPITSNLLGPNVSLSHIFQNRERLYDEILSFYDSVCNIGNEATLENNANTTGIDGENGTNGEDANREEDMHNRENASVGLVGTQQPPKSSTLNPFAKDWTPSTEGPSLEDRSLFMTFSRGHPLSEWEIANYFQRNYGNCLENIFIFKPRGREPEFGKITFKLSFIPRLILKDKEREKIYIGRKTVCLKKYNSN